MSNGGGGVGISWWSEMDSLLIIIIMQIPKAPTLRLKALNKHIHIMYIEMENVIQKIYIDKGF